MSRRRTCSEQGFQSALTGRSCGIPVSWTRKVAGKTETRLLSAEQMERYRDWFANARRVRELTRELEALSLAIAESAEDWG